VLLIGVDEGRSVAAAGRLLALLRYQGGDRARKRWRAERRGLKIAAADCRRDRLCPLRGVDDKTERMHGGQAEVGSRPGSSQMRDRISAYLRGARQSGWIG
jgi:hypothetical protein